MTIIRARTVVAPDGKVTVPVGIQEAGAEVEVVVTPLRQKVTPEQYNQVLQETAASIDDPTFVRPTQWDARPREPLE